MWRERTIPLSAFISFLHREKVCLADLWKTCGSSYVFHLHRRPHDFNDKAVRVWIRQTHFVILQQRLDSENGLPGTNCILVRKHGGSIHTSRSCEKLLTSFIFKRILLAYSSISTSTSDWKQSIIIESRTKNVVKILVPVHVKSDFTVLCAG